ncbi:imidazolonepropionase-like domain-containing protein [Streptomyces griseorubiginosus]|uniref:imidazolonepropionase-like domain-containing protein n=1 Tax=Streptomyces griseorubiginosus TaxID=67304 RepID=UPI0036E6416A
MLTIHIADELLRGDGGPPLPAGAVLVEGRQIAAVEVYDDLVAAHPTARVRRWPGVITPGLLHPDGPELLERSYHPDPREDLGSEPLTGEALSALDMTEARWGASARRGVQRLLAQGTVAVAGPLRRPAVIDAVHRSGLRIQDGPTEAVLPALLPGADATFAIFDAPECVATVIGGRLLHRRR